MKALKFIRWQADILADQGSIGIGALSHASGEGGSFPESKTVLFYSRETAAAGSKNYISERIVKDRQRTQTRRYISC